MQVKFSTVLKFFIFLISLISFASSQIGANSASFFEKGVVFSLEKDFDEGKMGKDNKKLQNASEEDEILIPSTRLKIYEQVQRIYLSQVESSQSISDSSIYRPPELFYIL